MLTVTDHTCTRYFERVLGIDRTELEATILEMLGNPSSLIDGSYPSNDRKWRFIVRHNRVITIQKNKKREPEELEQYEKG